MSSSIRRFDPNNPADVSLLKHLLSTKRPKIYGGYQRELSCMRTFQLLDFNSFEVAGEGLLLVKTIFKSNQNRFYPVVGVYDFSEKGRLLQIEVISQNHDFLIPAQLYIPFRKEEGIRPIGYRTIVKLDGDHYQDKWPNFSEISDSLYKEIYNNL